MSSGKIENVVIVGGGPAGYTAALYAARAGLKPLVIEGATPLGALALTSRVENFPGFPAGVDGRQLASDMRAQAAGCGARIVTAEVTRLELASDVKTVQVDDKTHLARAVIVATGAGWRSLGVPGEERLFGLGVSTCATCDGAFYQDANVAVIGGGDSAMEEALYLANIARSVTVIHRRRTLRASQIMQDRALNHPKIHFIWDAQVTSIDGSHAVEAVTYRETSTGRTNILPVDGVFLAIGHTPRTSLVQGQLDLDSSGYICVKSPSAATSLPGVFAAGDAADPHYRQAVTAAASGCVAALDARRWLEVTLSSFTIAPSITQPVLTQ